MRRNILFYIKSNTFLPSLSTNLNSDFSFSHCKIQMKCFFISSYTAYIMYFSTPINVAKSPIMVPPDGSCHSFLKDPFL